MGIGYGKLLLFGEHAVVHGHPAVGVGCTLQTSFFFEADGSPPPSGDPGDAGGETLTISASGRSFRVRGISPRDRDSLEAAIVRGLTAAGERGGIPDEATTILVDSTVPRGVGLGSSAALCAAIADALYVPESSAGEHGSSGDDTGPHGRSSNHPEPLGSSRLEALASIAHEIEHLYHGKPSGVDTALSVYGGIRAFSRGATGAAQPASAATTGGSARSWPLSPAPDSSVTLLYGHVPRSGDTKGLVARISQALSRGDRDAVERIEELGRLSGEAIAEMDARKPDAGRLGALAWKAHAALGALGLSTQALETVLAAGRHAGARGGKLSGAGGGGAWFLLFDDPEHADAGRTAIREQMPDTPMFTMPLVPAGQT